MKIKHVTLFCYNNWFFFSNKIVSERMENFHYLNGVKCLQLAHDCAHVIFPQTLKIQYGGPQAINSMRMSGS